MGMKHNYALLHKEIAALDKAASRARETVKTSDLPKLARETASRKAQLKRGFVAGAGGKKGRRIAMRMVGYRGLPGYGSRRGE